MASTPADAPLVVVDKVTETRSIDDSQAESYTVLFDIFGNEKPRVRWQTGQTCVTAETGVGKLTSTDALDGDGFGTLCARREGFLLRIEGGIEKSVYQGRLAEARLACTPKRSQFRYAANKQRDAKTVGHGRDETRTDRRP